NMPTWQTKMVPRRPSFLFRGCVNPAMSVPVLGRACLRGIYEALTASDDGAGQVRCSVGQAEQPGVPCAVGADAELVLVEGLGAVHDGLVYSVSASASMAGTQASCAGRSSRTRLTHPLNRGTQRTN